MPSRKSFNIMTPRAHLITPPFMMPRHPQLPPWWRNGRGKPKTKKKVPRKKGGNLGAVWGAIPNDFKRQLGQQLAKDFALRVVAPAAAAVGAHKLYRKIKSR